MKLLPAPVPSEYRCPICVEEEDEDHKDATFYSSSLFGTPICEVCDLELSMFADEDKSPPLTTRWSGGGLACKSWEQCRVLILQDELRYSQRIKAEQPEEWFQPPPHEPNRSREESEEILETMISAQKEKLRELGGT